MSERYWMAEITGPRIEGTARILVPDGDPQAGPGKLFNVPMVRVDTEPARPERDDDGGPEIVNVPGGEGGNLPDYTATEDQTRDPHAPPQGPTRDDMRAVPFSGFAPDMFDDDPSGGEGAPEPDDRVILKRLYLAAIGSAGVYPSHEWGECATKDYQHLRDRLPLEREAEAREPDTWMVRYDGVGVPDNPSGRATILPMAFNARYLAESFIRRHQMGEKWRNAEAIRVYLGTPGPDREDEIRADERRSIREGIDLDALDGPCTCGVADTCAYCDALGTLLARLSPTDEQESPTGDER